MRAMIASLSFILALGAFGGIEAKPRKRAKPKKAAPAKVSQQTQVGIEKLMGVYKWGMSPPQVFKILEKSIHAEYEPQVKKTDDPMEQDRIRKEKTEKIKDLRNGHVRFGGKQTPWDISMVDKEFAHKNSESMVVVWTKEDRRFFFFHNDKLYKLYIAFNADLFQGKTFEDFAKVMEARFGPAERKLVTTIKGEKVVDHLAWGQSGTTLLRAIDNTKIYSNFCLVLAERSATENVNAGRRVNSPKRKYSDPLIDAVTRDSEGGGADSEENVVDRITGRGGKSPTVSDSANSSPPSRGSSDVTDRPVARPGKKKIDAKNPLDGLDI